MIKLTLPIPISVNQAYAWKARRFKSKVYKEWEAEATAEYYRNWEEYSIEWDEWLEVNYKYFMPLHYKNWKKKVQDVFNYEKCLSDWISHNIEWFEDHKIKRWIVEKFESNRLEVEIEIKET